MIDQAHGGVGLQHITKGKLEAIELTIPPLAEQDRIVARLDELMAHCDELERKQTQQRKVQVSLNDACLDRVLAAENADEFAEHWRRVVDNFDVLYDDAESVAKLKRALVQLALQGVLIRGAGPPVSPPSGGNSMRGLHEAAPDAPFAVPEGWTWVRLGQISHGTDYGTSQKASDGGVGVPVYRMGNIQEGVLVDSNMKYVPAGIDDLPALYLQPGDLLFNRTNSAELVGKAAVYFGPVGARTFASYLIRVRVNEAFAIPAYVNLVINAPYFRSTQIAPELTQQCGQANFNGTKLVNTAIPLPSLSEQALIVRAVGALHAECDALLFAIQRRQAPAHRVAQCVAAFDAFGRKSEPSPSAESKKPTPAREARPQHVARSSG